MEDRATIQDTTYLEASRDQVFRAVMIRQSWKLVEREMGNSVSQKDDRIQEAVYHE